MEFSRAIVRRPGKSLVRGITTAKLGRPDYQLALAQHDAYISALEDCGLQVRVLEAAEDYPDAVFIEDVALLTPACAIQLRPGAQSRRGEIEGIASLLAEYFQTVHRIAGPATVEGGDILRVGDDYYIGLSGRTNQAGAEQVIAVLERCGLAGTMVPVADSLHLKTGIAFLENHLVIANPALLELEDFQKFPILKVEPEEAYAANCLDLNGTVLLPAGFPETFDLIRRAGYPVKTVDVSEFQKLDGGLSCLSLRF